MLNAINPKPGQSMIEIGPGQGALTYPLLERCKELTAIELDRDLIPILKEKSKPFGHLHLINSDILQVNLSSLPLAPPLRVVGNLPYNISTPLMFHLLKTSSHIDDMHFMVQKEVALRITANPNQTPNTKHYGRLSVMIQYYCECEYLFDVPPGCFTPPPKVESAIIRLKPYSVLPIEVNDIELLGAIVKMAFNQRRKTISNSLKKVIDSNALKALKIDPKLRPENLHLSDFAIITNHISDLE